VKENIMNDIDYCETCGEKLDEQHDCENECDYLKQELNSSKPYTTYLFDDPHVIHLGPSINDKDLIERYSVECECNACGCQEKADINSNLCNHCNDTCKQEECSGCGETLDKCGECSCI
jgi:hypothetical protein